MIELRTFMAGLSTRARWGFAAGLLAIVLLAWGAGWWVLHPAYAPLVQNLTPADASEIGSALSEWGVPYQFEDGDKTILVPDDQIYAMRMKLAAEGIPKGGSVGFEMFKDSDYGVTEFSQQVNYQRALQGELERTVESMREIQSARVHLTIHHAGLFEQDQEPSKGSVTLHLRPGQHIAAKQVVGIQRLVASAVEGLQPQAVTVLSQDGTVLSGSGLGGLDAASVGDQVDGVAKLEQHLRQQVGALLTRALHRDDFTVSVAVQLNYARVKRVEQRLLAQGKDGNGLLVHEKTDSSRAPATTAAVGAADSSVTSRDTEYAHGNEQEEIEEAPGRIQRISVGVVIPAALNAADIKELSDVVSAGVGLDPSRGDRLDIAAITPWIAPEQSPASIAGRKALPAAQAESAAPKVSVVRTLPYPLWIYLGLGAGVLLAIWLGALLLARVRAPLPRRLSAQERKETLERLTKWIELPERSL